MSLGGFSQQLMGKLKSKDSLLAVILLWSAYLVYIIYLIVAKAEQNANNFFFYPASGWISLVVNLILFTCVTLVAFLPKFDDLGKAAIYILYAYQVVSFIYGGLSSFGGANNSNNGALVTMLVFYGLGGIVALMMLIAYLVSYLIPTFGEKIRKFADFGLLGLSGLVFLSAFCGFFIGNGWWINSFEQISESVLFVGLFFAVKSLTAPKTEATK
jgi:hypothetical protein